MLIAHFIDLIPIWMLLIGTILIMILFIEFGFSLGKKAQPEGRKVQAAQVRAIMGASLGLLALTLAFTFSTSQSHYEARVQNLVEEARIARNAFMQADLIAEPQKSQAKQLLKEYVALRSGIRVLNGNEVEERLADFILLSEQAQRQLWILAVETQEELPENRNTNNKENSFMLTILGLTDVHYARLHSALMNRIPVTIWMTLYLMATLSMIIMGYQAGLSNRRSPIATVTLACAFALVIILITDLDRPIMSLFDINNQLLVDLYHYMDTELQLD